MKNFTVHSIVKIVMLLGIFTSNAYAQNTNFSKDQALQLVKEKAAALGFSYADVSNLLVSDAYYDKTSNANMVYLQQTYKGVRIYNAIKSLAFRNGKVMSAAGSFLTKLDAVANNKTGIPALSAAIAVGKAAAHVGRPISAAIQPLDGKDLQKVEFPSYNASQQNILAKLLWVSDSKGNLCLSWQVKFLPVNSTDYWLINVDAQTGNVIGKDNLTVYDNWDKPAAGGNDLKNAEENNRNNSPLENGSTSGTNSVTATYKVVAYPAESPIHPGGVPSIVTDPFNNAGATNPITILGWHNDGTTDYNYTRGNNVWAREDRANNNGSPTPGLSAISTTALPSLTFDFPFNPVLAPTTTNNQKFAITHLFYWNNIMHDIPYQYGFDEVAGNFQNENSGRGGLGGDYVIADAQDGGGTSNANFATDADGIKPRMQMYLFTSTNPNRDGDLDNGVMGHEYTHGISTRLTGGPSIATCLTNAEQMGEGWSDYVALMTTTNWQTAQLTDGSLKRPVGNYVMGQPITGAGIRTYPYSTDMTIDKWTYAKLATGTQNGEVHLVGEIFATVLWDMTWNIIQKVGVINPNFYDANAVGGNSIAMKLVMVGMKLQACRPGFLDGRDAILRADTLLYNGLYSCAIWSAFARRGMGVKAKQGSSDSYTDQVADYTLPDAVVKKMVDKSIADQNQELNYTINVSCKCVPITNYKVVDTLNANLVDYVSGGMYDAPTNTVSFTVPSLLEGQNQLLNFTAKVKTGTYFTPVTLLLETVETPSIPVTFAATATGAGAWSVSNLFAHSGTYSLKAADPTTITTSKQTLTSTSSYLLDGISTLSFYHYYNTEPVYDGGVVELSVDGGTTWFDAGPYMFQNGYNASILTDSKQGFVGNSGGFILTKVNLSAFKGKSIKFRFVFSSDANTGADGWYVDDITLDNRAGVYNVAKLFDASNVLVDQADTSTLITDILPLTWGGFTAQKDGKTAFLKWTTLQEQNTSFFTVERSTDGIRFESIGTVKASGNSSSTKNYTLTDGVPAKGINYYRIRQVDRDGNFGYSETRSLTFDKTNTEITITPNPARGKIAITVPGNKKALKVYIYSSKGEKVGTFTINGEYLKLNLPVYPSGVYYVTISGDEVLSTQKLVIE